MPVALLLTALVFASSPDGGTSSGRPEVRIQGNLVMPSEVYLAILQLPPDAAADERTASLVKGQILSFLHRSGYELAEARAFVDEGVIQVLLDEGQLEKVVLRGRLTVKTLQFKLALNLPHEVFNRWQMEREMKRLSERLGLEGARFELVTTDAVEHLGPQVDELPAIKGYTIVHTRRPWELHIFFTEHDWDVGFGLDLRSGYPDGLELGLNYQGHNLLLDDDRWRVAASGGGQMRRAIADDRLYPWVSRAFGELRWYSPKILARMTRPFIWVRGEGIGRQRPDLRIENYYHWAADASLNLQYEFTDGLTLSLGGGMQHRRMFGLEAPPGETLFVAPPSERLRSFALLRTDLVFDRGAERWDRRHALAAEARHFFAIRDPQYGEAHAEYQKIWPIGWHDVILRAKGTWHWGEVFFHDEDPVGRHLRSVFGDEYVKRVASVSAEFAFSITRDLIKVSVFHDFAVYGSLDRQSGAEELRIGNAFGPGFHTLIEGMLQFDLYLSFGFTKSGFDAGVAAVLQKVF